MIKLFERSSVFTARLCKGSTTDSDSVCKGSNPFRATKEEVAAGNLIWITSSHFIIFRDVAQFGRALRSGRRGRGFESRHPDQKNTPPAVGWWGVFCRWMTEMRTGRPLRRGGTTVRWTVVQAAGRIPSQSGFAERIRLPIIRPAAGWWGDFFVAG